MTLLHMGIANRPFFKECRKLRNYSSWITIAIAVHSVPMCNLEFTRNSLTNDCRLNFPLFATLSTQTPILKDILDNHPATVRVGDTDLINFERYNKFMDRIKEVAHYTPPELQEYRDTGRLEYLLDSLSKFPFSNNTEDALLARSRDLKAEEKKDVDVCRNGFVNLGFRIPNT